jgi:hypothetical protein
MGIRGKMLSAGGLMTKQIPINIRRFWLLISFEEAGQVCIPFMRFVTRLNGFALVLI